MTACSESPQFSRNTEDVLPFVDDWLAGEDERFIRKVKKIFENAAVDTRYSIMEPADVFTRTSFEEKNEIYKRESIKLGEAVLLKAFEQSGWTPDSLDFIITVSCTGIMIPSVDAYLINNLQLKHDIIRLPVTEMGCAAGISGIIYASEFLKANPGKRAAVIAFESPTATFQLDDHSMANVVSAAIFGDGAACVLLSSEEDVPGPQIIDSGMFHFYDAEHMMGFDLTNGGLKMVLDIEVPEKITTFFDDIISPFLSRNGLSASDLNHLIFHPGGKKIIQTVEDYFEDHGQSIAATKEILRSFGNMSSATVFYVLEKIMRTQPQEDEIGLMLSFGPGFSAQRVLLKW